MIFRRQDPFKTDKIEQKNQLSVNPQPGNDVPNPPNVDKISEIIKYGKPIIPNTDIKEIKAQNSSSVATQINSSKTEIKASSLLKQQKKQVKKKKKNEPMIGKGKNIQELITKEQTETNINHEEDSQDDQCSFLFHL
jgi:hypothetical protein